MRRGRFRRLRVRRAHGKTSAHVARRRHLCRARQRFPLAGAGALQHRRRRVRPLGGAGAGARRPDIRRRGQPGPRLQLSANCATGRTAWPICCASWESHAAIASPCCCRRRRRPPSRTSRPTSWAPSRCRCSRCSDRRRCNTGWPIPAPRPSITNRDGAAKLAEIRGHLPELKHVLCIDGDAPGCRDLAAALADQPADVRARRYRSGRPGRHHLHLRHHRASRRARCMRIACCWVICRAWR